MSPSIVISMNCRMLSLLTSVSKRSAGLILFQACGQVGKLSKGVPTSRVEISYFISTASAGAVKYSKKIKNIDQVTD